MNVNYSPTPFFRAFLVVLLLLLVVLLQGCGGGGGGGGKPSPRFTTADRCAAVMDSIYGTAPHSDWERARSTLPAADPLLVERYRQLGLENWDWLLLERDGCYQYAGYTPGWAAGKRVVARRMTEMAAVIEGQCQGDETIGEC